MSQGNDKRSRECNTRSGPTCQGSSTSSFRSRSRGFTLSSSHPNLSFRAGKKVKTRTVSNTNARYNRLGAHSGPRASLLEASVRCPHDTAAVAPSTSQTQGLSRRNTASSAEPNPSEAPTTSLAGALARERTKRRGEPLEDAEAVPFWQRTWFLLLLLAMATASFALALLLYLGLDLPEASPAQSYAADPDNVVEISYGSVIKLMHERTKFRLHSHDVPYGSGSGQQSVTSFPNVDDANSYWIVRPQPDTSAKQGDAITHGTTIRLQHMRTRKWLHSHLHASPITGNMEVSCFGGEVESDTGDYWMLEIEGNVKTWRQNQRIRLRHVDTGGYLHSHDRKYTRIAGGQQEVCGVGDKRPDNVWLAAEGVYVPVSQRK
ncbi:stromal cell-derived factor 2-like protein isoform X2 [Brachypodium distachyon]|nr:stromal cell-derived factor 2-like protein isoform X2 [Brachypodium distachyon]|eukprot:XP_003573653.2 stromal cell-derived factor 2-like protein isoform X2 [Brachypodium distachyon]